MVDLIIWLVQPGRKLVAKQLACPFCDSQREADLFFGEPRYDPDATVEPVATEPPIDYADGEDVIVIDLPAFRAGDAGLL